MKRYRKGVVCLSVVALFGIFVFCVVDKEKLIFNEKMDIQNSDTNKLKEYMHKDLMKYGVYNVETPYFQIDLNNKFIYRKGVGILYNEVPGVVSFDVLQMKTISDTELCFYLDRGYCIEKLSPIESLERKENGVEVLYGVFAQSYYALSDYTEIFGLTGEEEDYDKLLEQAIEEFHVILFYQPDFNIQYRLMANRRLVSYKEILDLAGKILFNETAFTPEACQKSSNYSLMRSDESKETERLQQMIAEQKKDALTPGKALLKVTSFNQEQNLVPKGLFALEESDNSYILCLHNNGWPIGRLTVTNRRAEINYFDLSYKESLDEP